jgi:dolichol-phosphate mannosyltransferase
VERSTIHHGQSPNWENGLKILIAIPVYNERQYAGRVLDQILSFHNDVLVVDDGSTDGTGDYLVSRSDIALIRHPENRGYGQSLIDAFKYADERGYDWVITMDCDEQHEPSRIPCFVEECLKDDADIISGSRYLQPAATGEGVPPPDRRNINRLITELLNSSLHLNVPDAAGITDAFCGFKAHRVSAMRRMNLTISGYAFPMQFWVQADALGLRIRELAVKLIYKDATRHFGGQLDDPAARLQHYLEVLTNELREVRQSGIHARRELAEILFE